MVSVEFSGVEVAVDVRAEVGEGPHWDERTDSLWFVDLTAGTVFCHDRATGGLRTFSVGQEVGAAIPRQCGGLVLAVRDGIAVISDTGDGFDVRLPIERESNRNRMNDAKCDPAGRLLAGTTAFDFASGAGALYCVDADWSCEAAIEGVTTSNGTAWSPDGTELYFIDSATQGVDVFDYDVLSGTLANRRRLVTIDRESGIPDGMTVDADGKLWVACFGGGCIRCFSPSGDRVGEIGFPVTQVTSCAFGGPGYSELYVTSASYRMTPEEREREPLAGATFVCRPGVVGVPASMFAG
jgi:sugar lactone lactonase YvrE